MTGDRSLRIALLHPSYWPEVRRGSERFIRALADGLLARGHRPTLITSHPDRPSRAQEDGLEVIRNWRPPEERLRRRAFQPGLTHLPLTYLSLLRGDFDLAHALYPTDALAALRWGRRRRAPVVVSYMGLPDRASAVGTRGRLATIRQVSNQSAAAVALSDAAADAFREVLGIDTRVIAPGVDLDAFAPGGSRDATPTVFCPADHEQPRKRVELLVAALARVRELSPEVRLVLSQRPGRALPGAWTRAGVVGIEVDETNALVDAYRRAWLTALPSVCEAFGLVLVESLACGTPVAASDEGALPEIVNSHPDIGRLFSGAEVGDVAQALVDGLELAGRASTPARCRTRAEEYPWSRCVDSYEALYQEVLGRRAANL